MDDVAECHIVDGRAAVVAQAMGDAEAGTVDRQVAETEGHAFPNQPPGVGGRGADEVAASLDHCAGLAGQGQVTVDQNLVVLDEGVAAEDQVAARSRVRHSEGQVAVDGRAAGRVDRAVEGVRAQQAHDTRVSEVAGDVCLVVGERIALNAGNRTGPAVGTQTPVPHADAGVVARDGVVGDRDPGNRAAVDLNADAFGMAGDHVVVDRDT